MRRRAEASWVLGITLLALAVRLVNLAGQSLWVDEGITFARAVLPWRDVVLNLSLVGNQTPLYYTLVRLWLVVAGTSEVALRFPSVIAASLTVPILYIVGREVDSSSTGLIAATLLALNPFHVWYAQEARMYALGTLVSGVVLVLFVRVLRRPGWRGWALFALASGMAYLVHYFTLTLAAAQFLVFLCTLRRLYPRLRRWVGSQAVAFLPVGLWITVSMIRRGTTRLGGGWIPRPSFLAPIYTFFNLSLGYQQDPSALIVLGGGLFLTAFILAFWYRAERDWRLALLSWMGLPVMVSFLVSLRRPYYVDRYFTIILPGFVVWIALGVARLPRRWRSVALGALLVVSALATVGVVSGARFQKEDWRSAVGLLREAALPGDRLAVAGVEDIPVSGYYLEDALPLGVGLPEPEPGDRVWFLYRVPVESNHLLGEPASFDLSTQADPSVQTWLAEHRDQIVGEWTFPGLALFLVVGR